MSLDPKQPFYLRKTIIHPTTGNVMPPLKDRTYPPGSIPASYFTPDYVYQPQVKPPDQPAPPQERSLIPSTPADGSIERTIVQSQQTVPPPSKEEQSKEEAQKQSVNINTDEASEIMNKLDGVGERISARVVEARKNTPFTTLDDLDQRVPLPVNRKWEMYKDQIVF